MEFLNKYPADFFSWQQAWRLRCCPPEVLLTNPADDSLSEHLAICPWCRATLDLPQPILPVIPATPPLDSTPSPGHVYAIRSQLAGWGPKSRYYNAPLVLVLSCPDKKSVLVSQIYGDQALAGPGDVCFADGLQGFAESWNCYTLMTNDLESLLGEIDATIVDAVLTKAEETEASLQPGSLLWFFRQMEVETGYYFARQAGTRLMTLYENEFTRPLLTYIDPQELWHDLQCLPLTQTSCPPTNMISDLLAYATADERRLPLAAAEEEGLLALVFTVAQGRITSAATESLTLSFQEYHDGILTVTGSTAFDNCNQCTWLFWWQIDQELISPLPGQSGCSDGIFWAAFPLEQAQAERTGTLIIRLVQERED